MPKLYGAPAYARPPVVGVDPTQRPFDPDDLPLESQRTEFDQQLVAELGVAYGTGNGNHEQVPGAESGHAGQAAGAGNGHDGQASGRSAILRARPFTIRKPGRTS
jgi:hypothetical protein